MINYLSLSLLICTLIKSYFSKCCLVDATRCVLGYHASNLPQPCSSSCAVSFLPCRQRSFVLTLQCILLLLNSNRRHFIWAWYSLLRIVKTDRVKRMNKRILFFLNKRSLFRVRCRWVLPNLCHRLRISISRLCLVLFLNVRLTTHSVIGSPLQ